MIHDSREVRPGPGPRRVLNEYGVVETVPAQWDLVPPGDAALSRRIKQDGPSIMVVEMRGRKRFSRGIWAPSDRIALLTQELLVERQDPSHQKRLDAGRRRRAVAEVVYGEDFRSAVRAYLNFSEVYREQAAILASLIAAHATPVGSGTVARTARIPIGDRAAAATIAWLRHQTTGYDQMVIPRAKGRRREVRRMLAQRSTQLLAQYRSGRAIDAASCPLNAALQRAAVSFVA
jgi:hypothetical protein